MASNARRLLHLSFAVCVAALPSHLWAGHNALLPRPQHVQYGAGQMPLQAVSITLPAQASAEDQFASDALATGLRTFTGREVSVAPVGPGLHISLERSGAVDALPGRDDKPGPDSREAYQVRVTPSGAEIKAKSSAGLFYGVQTFLQLMEKTNGEASVPEVTIGDWPTLAYRGVMMDLSHGPLPTEKEIEKQIDFLARWKGNQYYFYSELSIELKGYPLINANARYSQDSVRRIIAYARQRHVDVVPCLEFYGHLHDLFRIEQYADLAPITHGTEINPTKPQMQQLIADWAQQMGALFPSPWFHVGLDEPWELSRVASAAAGGVNPQKLYVDHLNLMADLLNRQGKRMLFWADINSGADLFNKYPTMMAELPKNVIAVPWHYEAEKDFTPMVAPFRKAGIPEIVATGIWAWESLTPDFQETFGNIDTFLRDGKTNGTLGIINTNWADDAQLLYRMTLPGIAYGAIAAWQSEPIDRPHFFEEYSARMYAPETAKEVASALASLDKAQSSLTDALGHENALRLWDDPYTKDSLARSRSHIADLQAARLASEDAQVHLYKALELSGDAETLPSLLLGARLVDYAGMKFLYSVEIADVFTKLDAHSTHDDVEFWLNREASSRNHSRIADLMDFITELRETYRTLWLAEYTPFRLGTAIGRFDAEYEYWRKLQAEMWHAEHTYKPGTPVPTLDTILHPHE
jgi:hexosaminidase